MGYYTYILHSESLSRFYTGHTPNFDLRTIFHRNPDSRKFTYNADNWKLFLKIECQFQQKAMAIEKHQVTFSFVPLQA
ncbi:MAG: GIY-YIG nuclease family protein [Aequorivita sp.]